MESQSIWPPGPVQAHSGHDEDLRHGPRYSCWGRRPLGHTWVWGQPEASCCPKPGPCGLRAVMRPLGEESQALHLPPRSQLPGGPPSSWAQHAHPRAQQLAKHTWAGGASSSAQHKPVSAAGNTLQVTLTCMATHTEPWPTAACLLPDAARLCGHRRHPHSQPTPPPHPVCPLFTILPTSLQSPGSPGSCWGPLGLPSWTVVQGAGLKGLWVGAPWTSREAAGARGRAAGCHSPEWHRGGDDEWGRGCSI